MEINKLLFKVKHTYEVKMSLIVICKGKQVIKVTRYLLNCIMQDTNTLEEGILKCISIMAIKIEIEKNINGFIRRISWRLCQS